MTHPSSEQISPISEEQVIQILCGPREIPPHITNAVTEMFGSGTPIVDVGRFSEYLIDSMSNNVGRSYGEAIEANHRSVLKLGACSVYMAWQLAGNIAIPRERRLHEHNQSVLNTYYRVFANGMDDPRDRMLDPMLGFQGGGKSHGVAVALLADPNDPRPNRNQAKFNIQMAENVFDTVPPGILYDEEKQVIKLLIQQTKIGDALRAHQSKGATLDEAVAMAEEQLNDLREQCPIEYKDRFDDYLVVTYLSDAGAHTQRARYKDVATQQILPDVTPQDMYATRPDGSRAPMSLDRLFSQAPKDANRLHLRDSKHVAVMRALFPRQAKYYE